MIRDFLLGVSYVPRGFRLLSEPGVRRFVVIPLAVNIVVFGLLFWFGAEEYRALLNWMLPDPSQYAGSGYWNEFMAAVLALVRWLLWPVFVLAVAVVMFYTFTLVANLIGSPFNGWLSEAVESHERGERPPHGPSDKGLVAESVHAVIDEIRKLLYFLLWSIPLLILFAIPGINLAAPFLWGIFGAWLLGLEYMDFPMGNHGLAFKNQRKLLSTRRWLTIGFGAAILAMTVIPFVNMLAMPTGVVAGTLLWMDEFDRQCGRAIKPHGPV